MITIPLPPKVAALYKAAAALAEDYPGRPFTLDGHIVGSIGEVAAAQAFGLTLLRASSPGHDAKDAQGRLVQIKMTGGTHVSLYATCERLIVLKFVSPEEAEVVFDGDGEPVWAVCGKLAKNGQRKISIARLRTLPGGNP